MYLSHPRYSFVGLAEGVPSLTHAIVKVRPFNIFFGGDLTFPLANSKFQRGSGLWNRRGSHLIQSTPLFRPGWPFASISNHPCFLECPHARTPTLGTCERSAQPAGTSVKIERGHLSCIVFVSGSFEIRASPSPPSIPGKKPISAACGPGSKPSQRSLGVGAVESRKGVGSLLSRTRENVFPR